MTDSPPTTTPALITYSGARTTTNTASAAAAARAFLRGTTSHTSLLLEALCCSYITPRPSTGTVKSGDPPKDLRLKTRSSLVQASKHGTGTFWHIKAVHLDRLRVVVNNRRLPHSGCFRAKLGHTIEGDILLKGCSYVNPCNLPVLAGSPGSVHWG